LQVPEGRRIFSRLTVLENLELGGFALNRKNASKNQFENVFALFPLLFERKNQLGGTLSGGEQQMLAMARILRTGAKLLLLDEVMAGLNPSELLETIEIIQKINKSGVTILLTEHVMQAVMQLSSYVYVLSYGQVIAHGAPQEIVSNPKVIEAYLGREIVDA
jgi:branched-chain amino acid transport system ATP-binding protein